MSTKWDESVFQEWTKLRNDFRQEKKNKNYLGVIKISHRIIELDKRAKSIKIVVPLFYKEIGLAYLNLANGVEAKKFLELAINGFLEYRERNELNDPDDWLKDVELLRKKVAKIRTSD